MSDSSHGYVPPDPGWRSVLSPQQLVVILIPPLAMANAKASPGGEPPVLTLRRVLAAFAGALLLLLLVVALIMPFQEPGGVTDPVVWVLLAAGMVASITGVALTRARTPTCGSPEELVAQTSSIMFVGVALTESAALLGFVASFITDAWWPYPIGMIAAFGGMAAVAPTAARLRSMDEALQRSGCTTSLRTALYQPPATASEG